LREHPSIPAPIFSLFGFIFHVLSSFSSSFNMYSFLFSPLPHKRVRLMVLIFQASYRVPMGGGGKQITLWTLFIPIICSISYIVSVPVRFRYSILCLVIFDLRKGSVVIYPEFTRLNTQLGECHYLTEVVEHPSLISSCGARESTQLFFPEASFICGMYRIAIFVQATSKSWIPSK
jgi:hypothetical protein